MLEMLAVLVVMVVLAVLAVLMVFFSSLLLLSSNLFEVNGLSPNPRLAAAMLAIIHASSRFVSDSVYLCTGDDTGGRELRDHSGSFDPGVCVGVDASG
jgi:hypothetical protein